MQKNYILENRNEYLLNNFDRAIENGWIEIYIQPIVRSSNGKVCEEEALARWDDPVLGVLNPKDFIPVLEEAGAVNRLDLFILDKILEKMQRQIDNNVPIVSTSINFSQLDFQSADIINIIDKKVSKSGISKNLIAFEISAGSTAIEYHKITEHLSKLQKLGYRIELDDYGKGDISLLLAQKLHFDTLKFNMDIVRQIPDNDNAVKALSSLVNMATSYGIETVAKGVETQKQVDFLKEVGCSKHQGYFFCRPQAVQQLFDNFSANKHFLWLESATESYYFDAIDRINLHQTIGVKDIHGQTSKTEIIPAAVMEYYNDQITILRCNTTMKAFVYDNFPDNKELHTFSTVTGDGVPGSLTFNAIKNCINSDDTIIVDDKLPSGITVHLMLQKIAHNSETGKTAFWLTILSSEASEKKIDFLSFNQIIRSLSEDYITMYFVDLETNNYAEYRFDDSNSNVTIEKRGEDFFFDAQNDTEGKTYEEDREMFKTLCTKENILKNIHDNGMFSITYRANDSYGIRYVNFKAVPETNNSNHLIIGIYNVDPRIKQLQAYEKIREERAIYSRMANLCGNFYAIYCIDLIDDSFTIYKTTEGEAFIGGNAKGTDFFDETNRRIKSAIYKDDLAEFLRKVNKNNILSTLENDGIFSHIYRLIIDDKPTFFELRAVLSKENDDSKMIVGLINIDNQVRKEAEFTEALADAENLATTDALTGIKNKHAYTAAETTLNNQLAEGNAKDYAIIVFDLNNLKYINDTFGHKKGDEYIKSGCKIICETFAHSPVFRIGGDEFVAIAQGYDYKKIDYLLSVLEAKNNENRVKGEVTIAVGYALGDKSSSVNKIFEQADKNMYEYKQRFKNI